MWVCPTLAFHALRHHRLAALNLDHENRQLLVAFGIGRGLLRHEPIVNRDFRGSVVRTACSPAVRVISRLACHAVCTPGPEWKMSQLMLSALVARGLSGVTYSSHCWHFMSFLGILLRIICDDLLLSLVVATLLIWMPLRILRCRPPLRPSL